MSANRDSFIKKIQAKLSESDIEVSKVVVGAVYKEVLKEIKQNLIEGEKVFLNEIGTIKIVDRKERMGRNPKTNEPLVIPAKKALKFSASSTIIDELNK